MSQSGSCLYTLGPKANIADILRAYICDKVVGRCRQKDLGILLLHGELLPSQVTQKVQLECHHRTKSQELYHIWFLSPSSIMAL